MFHLMTSSWNNETYFVPDECNKNRHLFSKLDGKNHILNLALIERFVHTLIFGKILGTPEIHQSMIA